MSDKGEPFGEFCKNKEAVDNYLNNRLGKGKTERDRILSIIAEYAQRYSRGSVTRVALDNLILEIKERT